MLGLGRRRMNCIGLEPYFFFNFAISSLDSIHSSLKPHEAQRYRVTLMELKIIPPVEILFPAP